MTKVLHRVFAICCFMFSASLSVYAQANPNEAIQLDTLTKVIGIALTLGGFFMGYMQMRMANKIAEVEAKFNHALSSVEAKFTSIIHAENEKQNDKLQLGLKEMESKMVTRHDLNNLKQVISLQYENVQTKLESAASIYKKDNH